LGTAFFDGCGGVNPVIMQDTFSLSSILGNTGPFFVRKYYYQSMAPGDYYIARKFQNYFWYNYEGGNYAHLVGAIIDSVVYGSISGILNKNAEIPSQYKLYQNYPNPFNPKTLIKFSVPERSYIRLVIIDAMGQEVEILYDGYANLGEYQVEFDGSGISSGVYFYKLQTKNFTKTMKMVLIK
jgi:hypothetical protein